MNVKNPKDLNIHVVENIKVSDRNTQSISDEQGNIIGVSSNSLPHLIFNTKSTIKELEVIITAAQTVDEQLLHRLLGGILR